MKQRSISLKMMTTKQATSSFDVAVARESNALVHCRGVGYITNRGSVWCMSDKGLN